MITRDEFIFSDGRKITLILEDSGKVKMQTNRVISYRTYRNLRRKLVEKDCRYTQYTFG